MGRLIDADSFEAGIKILFGESNPIIHIIVNKLYDQPTVEAIPKDQYENRLKADMVAMLTELKTEITEKSFYYIRIYGNPEDEKRVDLVELDDVNNIIQEKIDNLKENINVD